MTNTQRNFKVPGKRLAPRDILSASVIRRCVKNGTLPPLSHYQPAWSYLGLRGASKKQSIYMSARRWKQIELTPSRNKGLRVDRLKEAKRECEDPTNYL